MEVRVLGKEESVRELHPLLKKKFVL